MMPQLIKCCLRIMARHSHLASVIQLSVTFLELSSLADIQTGYNGVSYC